MSRPVVRVVTAAYPSPTEPRRAHFVEDIHRALEDRFQFEVLAPQVHGEDPLQERRHDVAVTRFAYRSGGVRPKEQRMSPVQIVSYLESARKSARSLWRKDQRRGLTVGHWVVPTGWVAARVAMRTRSPLVVYGHGSDLHHYAASGLGRWVARNVIRRADRVVTSSASLVRIVRDLDASKRTMERAVVEIPAGVEAEYFVDRSERSLHPRIRLLYVGDHVTTKGVDRIVELLEQSSDIELHTYGEGPWVPSLELHGAVTHGAQPAEVIARAMDDADLLLLPSDDEGGALVVREAIARGLPVAATPVGSVPDLFESRRGLIVLPPREDGPVAPALAPFLRDPQPLADLSRKLRSDFSDVEEELGLEATSNRFGDLLDETLEEFERSARR